MVIGAVKTKETGSTQSVNQVLEYGDNAVPTGVCDNMSIFTSRCSSSISLLKPFSVSSHCATFPINIFTVSWRTSIWMDWECTSRRSSAAAVSLSDILNTRTLWSGKGGSAQNLKLDDRQSSNLLRGLDVEGLSRITLTNLTLTISSREKQTS